MDAGGAGSASRVPVLGPVLCTLAVPVVPVVFPVLGPVLCTLAVPVVPVVFPVLGPVLCTLAVPVVPVVLPVLGPVPWVTSFDFVLSSPLPDLPPAVSPLPSALFSPGPCWPLADTLLAPPDAALPLPLPSPPPPPTC